MSLASIVNVTITRATTGITRTGFGVPLIAAYHTHYVDRVRSYTSLAGMVSDGFEETEPAYLAAQAMFSQKPRVRRVKVGRRALAPTQIVSLTPSAPSAAEVYTITIDGAECTYTADGTPTLAEVCTGLAAAINAATGDLTAANASNTHVTCTADTAGVLHTYSAPTSNLTIADTTANPGIATDLSAILTADPDWYGLVLDSNSKAEILAAAAWIEARDRMLVAQSADTACMDSGSTTDVMATAHASAYERTALLYHPTIGEPAAAGWLGNRLPADPGSDTWAFKTLAGVEVYELTDTQSSNVLAKSGNVYTTIAGASITQNGMVAAGEFADVTRFVDWLHARIQEDVFALLVNRPKLPYTDASVATAKGTIAARLNDGIRVGGLADDPAPTVDAPLVADVPEQDRRERLLPDMTFAARLAGAIHSIDIAGTVSV